MKKEKIPTVVRNIEDMIVKNDICGKIKAITAASDLEQGSLSHVEMNGPTIPHYHEKMAEFYFVLEGTGKIIVGYETHEIRSGTAILIPPGRAHYTIPHTRMKILVFSAIKAWSHEDQFTLEERDDEVDYFPFKEQLELIDEILLRQGLEFSGAMDKDARKRLVEKRRDYTAEKKLDVATIPKLRAMLKLPYNK